MKTKYNILVLLSLLPLAGLPQASLDSVIAAVRAANPLLTASRLQMEAEMKAARTGIYLPNPEVQFDYLWGDPASSGNRIDVGISQSFSFPTLYIQRSGQSGLIKTNATLAYLEKEREVIHEAKVAWIALVGLNRRLALTGNRERLAGEIAGKAKTQLARGEISAIGYHHAQMEFVNLKMERTRLEVEANGTRTRLARLCGGKAIPVADTAYPPLSAWSLDDLTGSLAGSPAFRSLENEIGIRTLDKQMAVSEWLPSFRTGFYSETVTGLTYQGVTTGISIPLFQNSNTVRTADLRVKRANAELDLFMAQKAADIASLFSKRDKLALQSLEIRSALLPVNDVGLLKKALDAGEINISEFYYECSVFYAAWLNLVASEEELATTEAELLFAAGK
jgi:outer membrane protein TolC